MFILFYLPCVNFPSRPCIALDKVVTNVGEIIIISLWSDPLSCRLFHQTNMCRLFLCIEITWFSSVYMNRKWKWIFYLGHTLLSTSMKVFLESTNSVTKMYRKTKVNLLGLFYPRKTIWTVWDTNIGNILFVSFKSILTVSLVIVLLR